MNDKNKFIWNDETIAVLIDLRGKKKTCAETARIMNGMYKTSVLTKNSIVSKSRRIAEFADKALAESKLPIGPVFNFLPVRRMAEMHEVISDLKCKWPFGDPKKPDFHFCEKKRSAGVSYCDHHQELAYSKADPKVPEWYFKST